MRFRLKYPPRTESHSSPWWWCFQAYRLLDREPHDPSRTLTPPYESYAYRSYTVPFAFTSPTTFQFASWST